MPRKPTTPSIQAVTRMIGTLFKKYVPNSVPQSESLLVQTPHTTQTPRSIEDITELVQMKMLHQQYILKKTGEACYVQLTFKEWKPLYKLYKRYLAKQKWKSGHSPLTFDMYVVQRRVDRGNISNS